MSDDFYEYFDVITMDFRGHGRSTGSFTFTAEEHNDLRAVINFAKEIYPKIGIIGFSLGAATAIIYTAKNKDIQSLIIVSAPTDFEKVENHFLTKEAVKAAIEKFEFGKTPNIKPGNVFLKKMKPIDVVQDISPIPVLFISGSKDPIIYPRHTLELYRKAGMPKHIENFENGFHAEDIYLKSKNNFIGICKDWFDKTMS
jgi:pimeloyl-ACP methyl ester carboxylesterase